MVSDLTRDKATPQRLLARRFLLAVAERCRATSPKVADSVRDGALDRLPDAVVGAACRCVYYRCMEADNGRWFVRFFNDLGEPTFTWTYGPPHIWRKW